MHNSMISPRADRAHLRPLPLIRRGGRVQDLGRAIPVTWDKQRRSLEVSTARPKC
jgi:hypothetical protein